MRAYTLIGITLIFIALNCIISFYPNTYLYACGGGGFGMDDCYCSAAAIGAAGISYLGEEKIAPMIQVRKADVIVPACYQEIWGLIIMNL